MEPILYSPGKWCTSYVLMDVIWYVNFEKEKESCLGWGDVTSLISSNRLVSYPITYSCLVLLQSSISPKFFWWSSWIPLFLASDNIQNLYFCSTYFYEKSSSWRFASKGFSLQRSLQNMLSCGIFGKLLWCHHFSPTWR